MFLKDSGQLSRQWNEANRERAIELNDMLDACASLHEMRLLFKTFTKEEQNGLLFEYGQRRENERAPVGSLVKHVHSHGVRIVAELSDRVIHTTYKGVAVVVGQDGYGGCRRYLMLQPPYVVEATGAVIHFAEAASAGLEVVK